MTIEEIANWVYLNKYAAGGYKYWKTISQEDAKEKSNRFLLWVIEPKGNLNEQRTAENRRRKSTK